MSVCLSIALAKAAGVASVLTPLAADGSESNRALEVG